MNKITMLINVLWKSLVVPAHAPRDVTIEEEDWFSVAQPNLESS
jgi:hypothetical protein